MSKPILARDLGDGPHKAFGSALTSPYAGTVERCPRIGRTIKPRAAGPCKLCGERRWFCECEELSGSGDSNGLSGNLSSVGHGRS